MSIPEISWLNQQFAVPKHVSFQMGLNRLPTAVIENEYASASMSLAGGQVLTYVPRGCSPVLWVSPNSAWQAGRAIRGGIPVCWPWFGTHPDDSALPQHGLARTALWSVSRTQALGDGSTVVSMVLRSDENTLRVWPHEFELEVTAVAGPTLRVEWVARNPGDQSFTYTGALHAYFTVGRAKDIAIQGLDACAYLDKTRGYARSMQHGPLNIQGEVDRVYLDTTTEISINDPVLGRTLAIRKSGSRATVVWNPGPRDAAMPDVGAGQHTGFVCVEPANTAGDEVTVLPGQAGRLGMEIVCA